MTTEEKPTEPHVHGENCNHDHDHDHENEQDDHEGDDAQGSNRGEKKFRKAMSKMGLKPVTGINRVTIKKGKAFVISIDDPDVWKSPGSENAYIIFGKPNMDGLGGSAGQSEVNQFQSPVNPEGAQQAAQQVGSEQAQDVSGEEVSEEGLSADNIKMVMEYTKCTKTEAIKALRETNDDSVNAIMKLTKWDVMCINFMTFRGICSFCWYFLLIGSKIC